MRQPPYHGWILGYDETTLAQEIVYNTTPNGSQGGIWESGCGPGVDTNGDLITITGNGTFDTGASPVDYGDSFLSLTPGVGTTGTMSVTSFFTPLDELMLDDDDLDMGSGGNLLLPDQPGPNPHLVIGIGKLGTIYLVNRDSMGGFNASGDQMVQELPSEVGGMFSTPAYWQGTVPNVGLQNMIYTIGVNDPPKMFVLANGMIQTPPASSASTSFGLDSPAHRRLFPPMARLAESCGRSIVRHTSQTVPQFCMPLMLPICRPNCTTALRTARIIPDRQLSLPFRR